MTSLMPCISSSEIHFVKVALFYGLASLSMNFLNKLVMTSYSFHFPSVIMFSQTLATISFLWMGKTFSFIQFKDYSQEAAYDFLFPSLSHAFHSILSLIALKGMNIPMYAALKRCTPLVNLFLGVMLLGKSLPTIPIFVSILSITLGCLLAGAGDYDFDPYTYCVGVFSVFAQGLYLTFIQRKYNANMTIFDMLYINSWNTLPIFMFVSMILGEPLDIWDHQSQFWNLEFLISVIALTLTGSILVYSQFLCTTVCSALTASLVGVAKSVIQTLVGFFTFGGVHFNSLYLIGLSMNLYGGIIYTYVKHKESKAIPLLPKINS